MKPLAVLIMILATCGAIRPVAAFGLAGCDAQRRQYPANWNDTSKEHVLFTCSSHYGANFSVKLGGADVHGRTMMSVVFLSRSGAAEMKKGILRIWLDKGQTDRLRTGKYFATVLRKENSCWIRGDLDGGTVLLMDNSRPPADNDEQGGPFYNKAPRFSVYEGNAYDCRAVK